MSVYILWRLMVHVKIAHLSQAHIDASRPTLSLTVSQVRGNVRRLVGSLRTLVLRCCLSTLIRQCTDLLTESTKPPEFLTDSK